MLELLSLNIHTMIGVLVWSNFALSVMLFAYKSSRKGFSENEIISVMIGAKAFQCVAWILLFYRAYLPLIITRYVGNNLLFIGFGLESLVVLNLIDRLNRKNIIIQGIILLVSMVVFSIQGDGVVSSQFVVIASIITAVIFLYPTYLYTKYKERSLYKYMISTFLLWFIVSLLLRALEAYLDLSAHLFFASYIQSMTFVSLLLIAVISAPCFLFQLKERADHEMMELATLDSLTRVLNRRTFMGRLKKLSLDHESQKKSLAILFIDIDYFKRANDTYGHDFGDEVLMHLANVLKKATRGGDLVCRHGGEEFIVVLSDTSLEGAQIVLDHIIKQIRESHLKEGFKYTVSVGIYVTIPSDTIGQMINNADSAMYQAKKNGRNQYVIFEHE